MTCGSRGSLGRSSAITIALALAALLAPAGTMVGPAHAAAETPVDADDLLQKELTRLRDFLTGPSRTFETRRDAAAGLLEKDLPEARAILLDVLASPSDAARAVLEKIAARDSAHEAFIEPLFQLLRSDDEATRRATAIAFGAYQGSDRVLAGLVDLARSAKTPAPVRLASVEALAQMMDPRSVAALVEVTGDPSPEAASAASRALADMTGLEEFASTPDRWADWWARHKDEPEAVFLRRLAQRFRAELARRQAALAITEERLTRLLSEIYEVADAGEKIRILQAHLEDPLPQVRLVAARQATSLAREVLGANNGGRQAAQPLLQALAKHVADDSPPVRAAAADALAAWQETSAGPALLARLEVEKTSEVRAALASALGVLKVGDAVGRLVAMLGASSPTEVTKAAGALGALGDRTALGAAAVEPALEPLGRLARTAPDPLVREAACRALAKIAHPSAEEALVAALQDQAAAVRFSAAQGLGNIGRAADPTVEALAARLQDDNKGVRQAVAAALAKLGGAEAARKMADRLKPGAEADPAVRNALWTAVLSIAQAGASPELAYELGSRFFALEGAEAMQRAAALYEIAQAKYPASDVGTQQVRALLERLVDAYVAGGMLEKAAPVLRQLLAETPPENPQRRQELKQQLGLILLEKGPYAEAGALLAEAVAGLGPAERGALLKAVLARTEALLQTDKPESALELLDAFRKAPAEGPPDQAEAFARLRDRATTAAVARAIANLSGSDDQVQAATAALKKIGRPAVGELLVALASAATDGRVAVETKILAALEAVTQRTDHGYDPAAPLADRLRTIEAWRASLPAPAANPSRP